MPATTQADAAIKPQTCWSKDRTDAADELLFHGEDAPQESALAAELLAALKVAREIIDNLSGVVHGKPADGSTIAGIDALIAKTEASV